MRKIPYTYCLVKYLHDPAAGEMLNVGVLLSAPSLSYIEARFNIHYERLSKAFVDFDGEHYREMVINLQFSIDKLRTWHSSPTLFLMDKEVQTVDDVIKRIMPDRGLSIQFGPMLAGLADNPDDELTRIFDQAVVSQYPNPYKKGRSDEDAWAHYRRPLSERKVDRYLRPKNLFSPEGFEYKFEHAFKNERWHILRPVNMDYAEASSIQDKATRILGEASALAGNQELSTYYILLGEPRNESHKSAYNKAKSLLNKIPLTKEIIEEDAADQFADHLAGYIEEHDVTGT